jgi:hypothetical protein
VVGEPQPGQEAGLYSGGGGDGGGGGGGGRGSGDMGVWKDSRGGHGLPIVSPGPAMPNPCMPCGWETPETALWPFQGWPPTGQRACSRLLPPWTPHAVRPEWQSWWWRRAVLTSRSAAGIQEDEPVVRNAATKSLWKIATNHSAAQLESHYVPMVR